MLDQSENETAEGEQSASNHDLADQMAAAVAEVLAPAVSVTAARATTAALARTAVGGTAIGAAGIAVATALRTPAAKRAIVRIARPLAERAVESARSGKLNRAAHQAADNAKHAAGKARSAASDIQRGALRAKAPNPAAPHKTTIAKPNGSRPPFRCDRAPEKEHL